MSLSRLLDLFRVFFETELNKNIGHALWDKAIAGEEWRKLNHPPFGISTIERSTKKNIQGHHSQVVNMTLWDSIPGEK